MIATSPPYFGLRAYEGDRPLTWPDGWIGGLGQEPTLGLYLEHVGQWAREMWRVLHPSGTFWVNIADSYVGSGGPGGQYKRLKKPGFEYFKNATRKVAGYQSKEILGVPWQVSDVIRSAGFIRRAGIIWHKSNGMPESPDDRPTRYHEDIFLFSKRRRYFYDQDAERTPLAESSKARAGRGRAAGNKWEAKSPGKTHGLSDARDHTQGDEDELALRVDPLGANLKSVWNFATGNYKGAHFATWPLALAERMIRLGTPEVGICRVCRESWTPPDRRIEGTTWTRSCAHKFDPIPAVVLDPFSGSGTTVAAASKLGRIGIGLDFSMGYCRQGYERLELDKWATWDKGIVVGEDPAKFQFMPKHGDDKNQLNLFQKPEDQIK